MTSETSAPKRTFRRSLFAGLRPTGIVIGTIFWAASLAPSILPRNWTFQGVVSALSFAVGYGIGVALGALARSIATRVQPNWRDRLPAVSPLVGRIALGVTVALGIVWVAVAFGWQNQQRSLVGIASASWFTVLLALVVTAAVAVVLIGLIRIFNYPFRSLDLWLGRHTRPWLANLIAAVVVAVVITIFLPDVLGRAFID
ncbi:MAG: alpha/beta-hydrolase N-terminal domain-containing protein [Acidimicrobiia bacterium]